MGDSARIWTEICLQGDPFPRGITRRLNVMDPLHPLRSMHRSMNSYVMNSAPAW